MRVIDRVKSLKTKFNKFFPAKYLSLFQALSEKTVSVYGLIVLIFLLVILLEYSTQSAYVFGYLYTGAIVLANDHISRSAVIVVTVAATGLTLLNIIIPISALDNPITFANRLIAVMALILTAWLSDRNCFYQSVENLFKSFPGHSKPVMVLHNINLQVYPGEFVCIVGTSGCGKSTLLNILAGLLPPSTGQVLIDQDPVRGPGPDRGMVFQSYTLFPWLSVADNIGFGLKLRHLSSSEQKQRIAYYLEVVGLVAFARAYPKQLSGGQKQRVAIARALANEPEVLLMDEPFGALDAQTKEQMQQFFHNLWETTGTTVLMITHDVEEAIFLSQRIYVMKSNPGQIQTEIAVQFPRHRDLELKLSSEFITIKRSIIQALRQDFEP